jgi:hypothetical protein
MGAPQIIWIVLASLSLTISLAESVEIESPRPLLLRISALSISAGLLIWGGFFS